MIRPSLVLLAASFLLAAVNGRAQAQTKAHSAPRQASTIVVNINTASAAEFEGLPGVGAKTASLIIEYRQKNGPFKKLEELMNVRGFGEKTFLKLRPQLTLGAGKADDHQ